MTEFVPDGIRLWVLFQDGRLFLLGMRRRCGLHRESISLTMHKGTSELAFQHRLRFPKPTLDALVTLKTKTAYILQNLHTKVKNPSNVFKEENPPFKGLQVHQKFHGIFTGLTGFF